MASDNSENSVGLRIGSFVSLITKSGVRYSGTVYFLSVQGSYMGLQDVKCHGTEGRKKDGPQIPPCDEVDQYVQFHENDIQEFQWKSLPPIQTEPRILRDTATIQNLHWEPLPPVQTDTDMHIDSNSNQDESSSIMPDEESDIENVNEMFKKDVVWGHLGKAVNRKRAIFDTMSYDSPNCGARDGQNRFHKRTKLDTDVSFVSL